jgi:YVTN family beta-propeller protein
MPFISAGDRAAGRPGRRPGALLAAVVAAGMAAPVSAAPVSAAPVSPGTGTPYLYVANSASNTVTAYDAATGTVTATILVGKRPIALTASPDGTTVYVANIDSSNVSVISTATNAVTTTIPVGASPEGVAVSPDGSTAYVANNEGAIDVISTATSTITATIGTDHPVGVAVSRDGSTVYTANQEKNYVSVISTATKVRAGAPGRVTVLAESTDPIPDPDPYNMSPQPASRLPDTGTSHLGRDRDQTPAPARALSRRKGEYASADSREPARSVPSARRTVDDTATRLGFAGRSSAVMPRSWFMAAS